MNKKNILKILFFTIFIIIIIYVFWNNLNNFLKKTENKTPNQNLTNNTTTQEKNLINKDNEKLKKISNFKVLNYNINENQETIFYISEIGNIYQIKDNKEEKIITEGINPIKKIIFSPNKEKFLIAFENPITPQWLIFDLLDKNFRNFYNNNELTIIDADWLNENAFLILNEKKGELNQEIAKINLKDLNYNKEELLNNLNITDVNLIALSDEKIILVEKPNENYKINSWLINLKTKEVKEILEPEIGLSLKKIKLNNQNFILKQSIEKPNIILFDEDFNKLFEIEESFIYKCSANNNKILCFESETELKLNKYLTKEQFSKDYAIKVIDFEGIDKNYTTLKTNIKYISLPNNINIDGIYPYFFKNKIYFINKYDNYLYEFDLTNNE